jgi:hypothetical protein
MNTLSATVFPKHSYAVKRDIAGRSGLRTARGQSGVGMVEGVIGLVLMFSVIVLGIVLFINIGLLTYYQGKIGMLADHAASYAASLGSWQGVLTPNLTDDRLSQQTKILVDKALGEMGFPTGSNVNVRAQQLAGMVRVSVTVRNVRLSGNGNILPFSVTLTDSAVASLDNDRAPMVAVINGIRIPAYGRFTKKLSFDAPIGNTQPGVALMQQARQHKSIFGALSPVDFSLSLKIPIPGSTPIVKTESNAVPRP